MSTDRFFHGVLEFSYCLAEDQEIDDDVRLDMICGALRDAASMSSQLSEGECESLSEEDGFRGYWELETGIKEIVSCEHCDKRWKPEERTPEHRYICPNGCE